MTAGGPERNLPGAAGEVRYVAQFDEVIDHGLGLTPLDALLEHVAAAEGDPVQLAVVAHRMRQRFMSLQAIGEHIGMTRNDVFLLLRSVPADGGSAPS